jgi:hypothetical protein
MRYKMQDIKLDELCELRDKILVFLWDNKDVIDSFSISKISMDNYWRDTSEAEENNNPTYFRPTITFFCLEACYALFQTLSKWSTHSNKKCIKEWRAEWVKKSVSAMKLLSNNQGTDLENIKSTMTGGKTNILSASHFGMVLCRLEQTHLSSIGAFDISEKDLELLEQYKTHIIEYTKPRLEKGLSLTDGDPEHPYLVYRVTEFLQFLHNFTYDFREPFYDRIARKFDTLAAGLAYNDITPASGVDFAFLWAVASLINKIPIPNRRWESCFNSILDLSKPLGDWPIGHALSSKGGYAVPSSEVANSILNALIFSVRWTTTPTKRGVQSHFVAPRDR